MLQGLGRVAALGRAIGDMRVEVDQAWQDGLRRPVDRRRPVAIAPGRHRGDPALDNADALVGQDFGRAWVDEAARADVDGLRGNGRGT